MAAATAYLYRTTAEGCHARLNSRERRGAGQGRRCDMKEPWMLTVPWHRLR